MASLINRIAFLLFCVLAFSGCAQADQARPVQPVSAEQAAPPVKEEGQKLQFIEFYSPM